MNKKAALPKAILWDMDGTLINNNEAHYLSWRLALEPMGIKFTRQMFAQSFGKNNRASMAFIFGYEPEKDLIERVANEKEREYRQLIPTETKLFPGVENWLSFFHSKGVRQAIATSAPVENLTASLDAFPIRQYFEAIVSGIDLPSKPNPDIFLMAAKKLGVNPQDCLVIEDSMPGLEAGRRAGMPVVCKLGTLSEAPEFCLFALQDYSLSPENYFISE